MLIIHYKMKVKKSKKIEQLELLLNKISLNNILIPQLKQNLRLLINYFIINYFQITIIIF